MKGQLRELLTNYGEISILWLDFSYPGKNGKGHEDWDSENLLKMVCELQPGILVNDRLDLNDVPGGWDFTTPEQFKVTKWPEKNGKQILWKTCQTFSGSWGYHCDENIWKSTAQLLQLLIESLSKGDNLLMNVGPTARGVFDSLANDRLEAMGEWMKYNSRSIYGCTQALSSFIAPENTILTYNPKTNKLYIHLITYPLERLVMKNMAGKTKYAQFQHDALEIRIIPPHWSGFEDTDKDDLILAVPVIQSPVKIPVIEIVLK